MTVQQYSTAPYKEVFFGFAMYVIVKPDQYGVELKTEAELMAFIGRNVTNCPEIRICDIQDNLVMHVMNQTLVYPPPPAGFKNRYAIWNPDKNKFEPKAL